MNDRSNKGENDVPQVSRRSLLGYALGGTAALGAVAYGLRSGLLTLDSIFDTEENVRLFDLPDNPSLRYAEFRGSTFRFYELQATDKDIGVYDLVFRANKIYGRTPIKGNLAKRAAELLSILDRNNVDISRDTTLKLKYKEMSGVVSGRKYQVPVYVN